MVSPILVAAAVVATSIAAALAALAVLSALPRKRQRLPALPKFGSPLEQAIFLFDDKELIDATGTAKALLASISSPGTDWTRLSSYLCQNFDRFAVEIGRLAEVGEFELSSRMGDQLTLRADWIGGLARLTISDLSREGQGILVDGLSQSAQNAELDILRDALAKAPILVWRTDRDGAIVWANKGYLDHVLELDGTDEDELTWPLPKLFPETAAGTPRRQRLGGHDRKDSHWYDTYMFPSREGTLNFALPADAEVRAEHSLRQFIQTLTKTFADLPIGLAIFDRERQLALFNPALVDLTSLGAEFLSARPTLFSFLDRLREARMIPEPKNYNTWRQQMAELEQAAASGLYEETWSLPSGQTYKVTGRPHPDGAVAFLLEDITAEISLTRRFRSEIELGQAVADSLDEAIAVFSPASELILSNAAYGALWQVDPGMTIGTVNITASSRIWQEMSHPTPVWGEIRNFVNALDERADWMAQVRLLTGTWLDCRCVPLAGGSTLVGFSVSRQEPARRRAQHDRTSEVAEAISG